MFDDTELFPFVNQTAVQVAAGIEGTVVVDLRCMYGHTVFRCTSTRSDL